MTYRKKLFTSDSPSEDKGYSKQHRHTIGGMQAYERGEMPISYWNKQTILKRVRAQFSLMKRDSKYCSRYKKFLLQINMSEEEMLKQISKATLDTLRKILLECRGTHYTGNFFRYTRFYGLVYPITMLIRVRINLVKPKEIVQLKLNL